jgi:lysozyme family protein
MDPAFKKAVTFALLPEHDGQGFHVTPGDTGGATAWGITKPTYATFTHRQVSEITDDMIRNITRDSAVPIYEKLFWRGLGCDQMPPPLGFMVFDFGCGTLKWAAVRLQRLVGAKEDGSIGPKTLAAVNAAWNTKGIQLVEDYHLARKNYYDQVPGHERWPGWYKRADRCRIWALELAGSQ